MRIGLLVIALGAVLASVVLAATPSRSFGPAGSGAGLIAPFASSVSVSDGGTVYVADAKVGEVEVFGHDGTALDSWSVPGVRAVSAQDTGALVVDGGGVHRHGADGTREETLVSEDDLEDVAVGPEGALLLGGEDGVQVVDASGVREVGDLEDVVGVAVGAGDEIFATAGGKVHRFTWAGEPVGNWSTGTALGLATTPDGDVLVAEGNEHRVGIYSPDGTAVGSHTGLNRVRDVASDCRGNVFAVDNSDPRVHAFEVPGALAPPCLAPTPTPSPTPTPTPTPEPPRQEVLPAAEEAQPELGRTQRATVLEGKVFAGKGKGRRALSRREIIAVGTPLDTSDGVVKLDFETKPGADRNAYGRYMSGEFSDGEFTATQSGDDSLVTLTLDDSGADANTSVAVTSAKKKRKRVWATGKGKFRTKGRHGAATVRGTSWLTEDRPEGTYFAVRDGVVEAENLNTGETRVLRAGDSWLAKAPCTSRRRFWIRVRTDPALVRSVTVRLRGRKAPVRIGRRVRALVNLRGAKAGRYAVKIRVRTTDGRTLKGKRVYSTCTSKKRSGAVPPL